MSVAMKMGAALVLGIAVSFATPAFAGITVSPYVSIKSTKSISPTADAQEKETTRQREEYGMRGAISFWRLFKFQLGAGQSVLTTTEKLSELKDEYGEIDYEEDLDLDTSSDPDQESRVKETQRVARATVILDPGFWIFIARFKAGVQATQRAIQVDDEPEKVFDPTYKPHSGVGLGIKPVSYTHLRAHET